MTPQQKADWLKKVSHRMAHMTPAEIDRAYKEARKKKASSEGTPEEKTRPTPTEWMLAMRAEAEEKIAVEEQGTGFDYIRERAPYNIAVPVEDKKKAEVRKATAHKIAHKLAREIAEKVMKKKADKKQKTTDWGYSKKKTAEDVLRDLLLATPRSEVEHTYESEEESKKQKSTGDVLKDYVKRHKPKDQGYSKKKTTEDVLRDLGLWAFP